MLPMIAPALRSARCSASVGGTAFARVAARGAVAAALRDGACLTIRGRFDVRIIAGARGGLRTMVGAPPWTGTAVERRSEAAAAGLVALGLRMSEAAAAGFVGLGLRMSDAAALGFAALP
jgi:hypothetical protein